MNIVNLDKRTVKQFKEGTHRMCSAEETLAKYMHLMPILGITRLANITGLDRIGLPVVVSIRPNSRALATSQGKGDSLASAKVSALFESIETWHAERVAIDIRVESYNCMVEDFNVVKVHDLPQKVNSRFDPQRPITWCLGYNLGTGKPIWVPYESVSINFVYQQEKEFIFCMGTNGLASGNAFSEAVLHALFEVIERDAWSLWNLMSEEQKKNYQVDLLGVKARSTYLKKTIELVEEKGICVAVWDITSNISIPTYYCVIVEDPHKASWRPIVTSAGCGTHLDPQIAFSRALNEAIQSRATVISGSRDDQFPADYIRAIDKQDHFHALKLINEPTPNYTFPKHQPQIAESFEEDIQIVLSELNKVNIDTVAVVDLSKDDIGVPVVKVIVPGLEGLPDSNNKPGARAKRRELELTQ
jgi:YcaO-like protein with predicted kinase domain